MPSFDTSDLQIKSLPFRNAESIIDLTACSREGITEAIKEFQKLDTSLHINYWNRELYCGMGINLIPDYIYAIESDGNKAGIGVRLNNGCTVMVAAFTGPLIIEANYFFSRKIKNPETYIWLVNHGMKQNIMVHAGNCYDAALQDPQFKNYMVHFNSILAHFYEYIALVNPEKIKLNGAE